MPNQIIYGRTTAGAPVPILVDAGGTVQTAASFSGTIGNVGITSGTITAVQGTVLVAGTVTTGAGTQPVSGTVGVSGTVPVSGTVGVSGTVPISGTVGVSGTIPITVQSGTVVAQLQPVTSGGLSVYLNQNAGTTGVNVKNAAGQLYGYYLANTGTVTYYFRLYDKASAPGTADTPLMVFPLMGTAAANVAFPNGIAFASGIGVRVTAAVGDTDTTAPAGTTAFVNLTYK